jgi:hypothetical protein
MTVDDHSQKVVGGRIVPAESTWDHLVLTRNTVERYGRPLAYYVDNHSIFRYVPHIGIHYTYHKGPEEGEIPPKRWDNAVKAGKGKLQPLDQSIDLDWVFAVHDTRKVRKDGTISYKGKDYKVGRFPGQEVTVCLLPGSKIMVYKAKDKLGEYHL